MIGLNIVFLWSSRNIPGGSKTLTGRSSWNSQLPNAEGTGSRGTRASPSGRRHRYASRRFGQSAFASSSGREHASSLCLTPHSNSRAVLGRSIVVRRGRFAFRDCRLAPLHEIEDEVGGADGDSDPAERSRLSPHQQAGVARVGQEGADAVGYRAFGGSDSDGRGSSSREVPPR